MAVVQDAARPLLSRELVERCIAALADGFDGAVAAAPVSDTIKEADASGRVLRTLDRATLWAIQTPQVFRADVLRRALDVDDAVLARIAAFERGLARHDARDFAAARAIFQKHASADPPSRVYAERCETYLATPPPADWRGEFALKTK